MGGVVELPEGPTVFPEYAVSVGGSAGGKGPHPDLTAPGPP